MLKLIKVLAWISAVTCLLALQAHATTVYLVRHAEKQDGGKDPALSECGQARAAALARYFNDIPLQAVYATPYHRTQQTAAAVANSQQLPVMSYHPGKPAQLQQQLAAYTQPVLIVGHSNTVPQLVTLLSGIEMAPLTELQYSLLYQVELGGQGSVILRHQQFECKQANGS